jgi:hypothetical protein
MNMEKINESYQDELQLIKEIFNRKSVAYGKNNIKDADTTEHEALNALYYRMKDKLNRYNTLVNTADVGDSANESLTDTLRDLANYALIACIVAKKDWE